MKDRYFFNYRQGAKSDSEAASERGEAAGGSKASKRSLLHDHRSKDALPEYLDDLEE